MDKLLKNRKLWCTIFLFLGIGLLYYLLTYSEKATELRSLLIYHDNGTPNNRVVAVKKPMCPDVSNGMMRGKWKSRPLSLKEKTEIETYLEFVRTSHGMPKSMQRRDGKCGTETYQNLFWFRALCNPKGPTPCCFHGKCVAKSPDECRCIDCYDLRTPIHPEYSTWIPKDPRCKVRNFTSSDACQLLHKTHLYMVGDSLTNQLYITLLLILGNNREGGAYRSDAPKVIPDGCKGMYSYSCREYYNTDAKMCKKSVSLLIRKYYDLGFTRQFHDLAKSLLHVKNTVLFVGIGFHDSFSLNVYHKYILPVILMMKRQKAVWPRIIWSTNHQFGILKTPLRPDQDNKHVEIFNKFMIEHLRQHKIPIFDTYNMTSGVMSQDGSHYGIGLNLMKVQMFLNFLQELKGNERW